MSFTFAQMDFAEMFPTSEALRYEWASVSGLGVESLEVPGMERRRFLETNRPATALEYTVILHADTEQGAEEARDLLMTHIDPSRGPQRLIDHDYPEWYLMAALSDEIVWERITWDCANRGYRYKGVAHFESYSDAAQRRVDEEAGTTLDGTTPITLDGNTRAWPTIDITGTITSNGYVTLTVSRTGREDMVIRVDGPLASDQIMRLNYDVMQFAVWNGETKVASLVNRMSVLDRLDIRQLESTTIRAVFSGSNTGEVVVYPNSRRQ